MWKNQYLLAMALCAGALSISAMGCELIASVDRSRIQGDGGSAVNGCADGMKNGDETDVDCGGTCQVCDDGNTCSKAEDCESGFCADGVCCDTACDSGCDACTAELKESGDGDGTCGPTKADTACGETECTDGVESGGGTCDGTSVECEPGEPKSCETFACDEEASACVTTCEEDAHCAKCHVCDADSGDCAPAMPGTPGLGCAENEACDAAGECKAANGQACEAAEDCGSGSCVDGVCCNSACDGECQACNVDGAAGTCSPLAAGAVDEGVCEDTKVCDGEGACKLAPTEACTADEECASGECLRTGAISLCDSFPTMSEEDPEDPADPEDP